MNLFWDPDRERAPAGCARLAHQDRPGVAMARPLGTWRRVDGAALWWAWAMSLAVGVMSLALDPCPRSAARVGVVRGVWAFALVLAGTLVLNVVGIWWGMPSTQGWAPDEMLPQAVLDGMAHWIFERLVQPLPTLSPLRRRCVLPPDARHRMASRHGLRRLGPSCGARHERAVRERVDGGRNAGGRLPRRGRSVRAASRALRINCAGAHRAVRLLREDGQRRRAVRVLVRRVARLLPAAAADARASPFCGGGRDGDAGRLHEGPGVRALRPHTGSRSRQRCETPHGNGAACSTGALQPPSGPHS